MISSIILSFIILDEPTSRQFYLLTKHFNSNYFISKYKQNKSIYKSKPTPTPSQ